LYQNRYDNDPDFAELNSFSILFGGNLKTICKLERFIHDAIGCAGILANKFHDSASNKPMSHHKDSDRFTILYLVPLVDEKDFVTVSKIIFKINGLLYKNLYELNELFSNLLIATDPKLN